MTRGDSAWLKLISAKAGKMNTIVTAISTPSWPMPQSQRLR